MHTILNNLLSNAVKYTPQGSIDLTLGKKTVDGADYVELSVADTGYGIDEKDNPAYIRPLLSGRRASIRPPAQAFGLASVQSLAERSRGLSYRWKASRRKGSKFSFSLRMDNTYPDASHKEKVGHNDRR